MKAFWLSLITLHAVTGQAPEDEDQLCFTLSTREPFVLNQVVLMSSLNYITLLESDGGPWVVLNEDNNNDGLTFTSQTTWTTSGATCSETAAVCGFEFGAQNNWLITQFINNTLSRPEVYIRLRYSINTQCTTGCLTTLDLHVLHTNNSDQNIVRNTTVFGSPTFSLTSPVRDGSPLIEVLQVAVNSPTTGFYLALRDLGTCVSLSEVTVFYPVCVKVSLDFGATFTEMRFPSETSIGRCFTNMATDLNAPDDPFVATCVLRSYSSMTQNEVFTSWTVNAGPSRCMCLPGYEFNSSTSSSSSQCRACQLFTFKNTLSNDDLCQPCPVFSNTTSVAMAVCPCNPGYFRLSDGSEDAMPCTRPPSAPRNVASCNINSTSVFIVWEPPEDNGGRTDLFYTVSQNLSNHILTNNTYITLTGLTPFIQYVLSVTSYNGVSSQDDNDVLRTVTRSIMILGELPSGLPQVTAVTPLSDTSFTVDWIISDNSVTIYNYTVTWTNLHTGLMDSSTVSENINSYTVTGLRDNDNYNASITAVGVCGMITSDHITVYDPPNEPQFEYCISYNNGQPVLQVISHVTVDTPMMSLSLTFSASYQTGNSSSQSATCSLLSDMQYNCTAEFAVDIIPSVDTIESVNVTVSGPYGSASSLRNINQRVNPILSIDDSGITDDSATLICELSCFSSNLRCIISHLATNDMDIDATRVTGHVTGSIMDYSYPTQSITLNCLNSGTAYNYCVIATNTTNMVQVGEPVCGSFTARRTSSENNDDSLSTGAAVAITFVITFILTLTIATIITFIVTYICVKQKFEKILQDLKHEQQNKTALYEQVGLPSHTVPKNDIELQIDPAYATSVPKNDIELQPDPAYATSHKVTMDNNPAYESCK